MFLTKLKTAVPVLLLVAALGVGAGGLFYRTQAAEGPRPGKEQTHPPPRTGDPTKPPDAQRMLQGTWQVVKAETNGKHLPQEVSEKQRWVIIGDKITIHYDDGIRYAMSYRLGSSEQPNAIDLTPEKKGQIYYNGIGIYEQNGDTLKVCFTRNSLPTARRPASFDPAGLEFSKDRSARLFVLRRVQEKEKRGGAKVNADPTKPPIPGAVPLKFDEPITINARSKPIHILGSVLYNVSIGRGTFHRDQEGRLTAKLNAMVVQNRKTTYWVYAAIFDAEGQLLGTASHKEKVQAILFGKTLTLKREIDLDFGISNAFRRAAYVVVTVGERDVPKP